MLYAELTGPEWAGLLTAGASALGVVIAAIFTGLKYLKVEDNKVLLQLEKVRAATTKLEATKQARDQAETIKQQAQTIKDRSEEAHKSNNLANQYALENATLKARFEGYDLRLKDYEKRQEDTDKRLQDCEEDREKLWLALQSRSHPPQQ